MSNPSSNPAGIDSFGFVAIPYHCTGASGFNQESVESAQEAPLQPAEHIGAMGFSLRADDGAEDEGVFGGPADGEEDGFAFSPAAQAPVEDGAAAAYEHHQPEGAGTGAGENSRQYVHDGEGDRTIGCRADPFFLCYGRFDSSSDPLSYLERGLEDGENEFENFE